MPDSSNLKSSDQWLIVLYSLLIQAVGIGISIYCFATFSLPWLDEFGASRRDVMLTTFWLQLATGVFSPFVGRAVDRFPIHKIILTGLALLLLSIWLINKTSALWQIWLIYASVLPLASTLIGTLAGQTLVTRAFREKRGIAFGISSLGTNFGGLVFPLLAASWIEDFGWRDAFVYLGLSAALVVIPLTLIVFRKKAVVGIMNVPKDLTHSSQLLTTKEIMGSRKFWIPVVGVVPMSMSFAAIQFNMGGLVRDLGLVDDLEITSQLTGLMVVFMMLGKLFYGGLGDRLDHRILFWVAYAMASIALVLVMIADSQNSLIMGIVFLGLGTGGILPLLALTISSRFPSASFGRVMGLSAITIPIGALSPVLAGWSYDSLGTYNYVLGGLLCVVVPVALLIKWLPQPNT